MDDSSAAPIQLLHVDDDSSVAEVTATYLERQCEQFQIDTATSPAEALDRLAAETFDCIISDYDMAAMNGIEFLQAVRDQYPALPFVLFTGKGSEEIASEAISAGVTDYLQKGTGTDQYTVLANRVRNAVEQYRSQRALAENRERMSLLFEESPLGVVEWNESFEALRVNDTAADIFGYDSADLLGRSWTAFVAESDKPTVDSTVSDLIAGDGGYHIVTEAARADGTEVVCEWYNRVITDDDGSVLAAFSQIKDITEAHRRRDRQQRQREALVELATDDAVVRGDFDTALRRITKKSAEVLDVPRVNVWLLDEDGETARCVDNFDRAAEEHQYGRELSMADNPAYHEALKSEWAIDADDARSDPRTADLAESYLDEFDIGALLDATLRSEGECIGFVCHEHLGGPREWTDDEAQFAGDVADIVHRALRNRNRNQRQRELREERVFIDQALDTLDDIFYVVEADGSLRRWNDRLETVTGYTAEEIADANAIEFFPAAEHDRIAEAIDETMQTGQSIFEATFHAAEGEPTPYEFTNARLTDSDGDLVGVVGVGRDLTERREQEREMEFFTQLVETVGVGVAVYREDGRYEYVNDAYASILETDADSLVGTALWEINPQLDPDHFERYWDSFEVGTTRIDETVHALDGVERPVQTVTTCREIHGETYHFGTITDISKRKEREREIQRQNERLKEFASIVSHDLRNPLQVADGRLEMARRECGSPHLEDVARAHDRMNALITDLLTLARQGETDREPTDVDLAETVNECWLNVETGEATLQTATDQTIVADPSRLRQLLENLIHNAVEHGSTSSRPGADEAVGHGSAPQSQADGTGQTLEHQDDGVTITLDTLQSGDGFYVADDGPGIPTEKRDQIFESGWSSSEEGTGFGLTIVSEIAASHDWAISIAESDDGGARFEFHGVELGS